MPRMLRHSSGKDPRRASVPWPGQPEADGPTLQSTQSREVRCDMPDVSEAKPKEPMPPILLCLVMALLLLLGCVNFVLFATMYKVYGQSYAYFVSQGINALYLVLGGIILVPKMLCTNTVTHPMRAYPKHKFLIMGCLDSCGTFLAAMGAVHTPGQFQPLLNQTLLPLTMLISRFALGARYRLGEVAAAGLIIAGACISIVPNLEGRDQVANSGGVAAEASYVRTLSIGLYFLSNLPMACSAVYKEARFGETPLDVWYLTQWVSLFQFIAGFAFAPLLMLPGLSGSLDTRLGFDAVLRDLQAGLYCWLQLDGASTQLPGGGSEAASDKTMASCAKLNAFWLLTGYCCVNVAFNTLGLYLTKHGSAVLNSMSYALLLPLTTLTFSLPLLGTFRERVSSYTIAGLAAVMLGFACYQHQQPHSQTTPPRKPMQPIITSGAGEAERMPSALSESLLGAQDDQGGAHQARLPCAQLSFSERLGVLGQASVARRGPPALRIHQPGGIGRQVTRSFEGFADGSQWGDIYDVEQPTSSLPLPASLVHSYMAAKRLDQRRAGVAVTLSSSARPPAGRAGLKPAQPGKAQRQLQPTQRSVV